MMLVTMNAQNGLAGVYKLNPYNSADVRLDAATIDPNVILGKLATEHGIERVYWLRLQSRGPHLWYVVKPTPFPLAMVFDARTGKRLDPLSDDLLEVVAGEALAGGSFVALKAAAEYNRYYEADRLPVVRATIAGQQPARLILSRDEGRTLRRLNSELERFEWWYRTFHVNQFSDNLLLWTTLLYACAAGVITLGRSHPESAGRKAAHRWSLGARHAEWFSRNGRSRKGGVRDRVLYRGWQDGNVRSAVNDQCQPDQARTLARASIGRMPWPNLAIASR